MKRYIKVRVEKKLCKWFTEPIVVCPFSSNDLWVGI